MARGPALGYWLEPPIAFEFPVLGEIPEEMPPSPEPPRKALPSPFAIAETSILPHDEAAEIGVLGSVLLDNQTMAEAVALLTPQDFYLTAHQRIFAAMVRLHEEKTGIDTTTLTDLLRRNRDIQVVGGTQYLARLLDETPTAVHATTYAEVVRRHSLARQGYALAKQAADALLAGNGKSPEAILASVAEKVREWEVSRRDQMPEFLSLSSVASMELPPLDPILRDRVFAKGQMLFVVGGAKLGKSIITTDLLLSAAMGEGHLWLKTADGDGIAVEGRPKRGLILSAEGGLYMMQWRAFEQRKRFPQEAMDRVVIPNPTPKFNFAEPSSAVLLEKMVRACEADIVVIDPLTYYHQINENHANEVMMVLRHLRRVREETGVAMVLVHHVSKPHEGSPKGRGTMRARGSTVWGADADTILALEDPDDESEGGPAFSLHFEVRNGPPLSPLLVWRDEQLGHTYTKIGGKGEGKNNARMTVNTLRTLLITGAKTLDELRELGMSRTRSYALQRDSEGTILRKSIDGQVYFYLPGQEPAGDAD